MRSYQLNPRFDRYQFVSFVHFLMKKVYPERYGRDDQPSLVIPHQYGAATEYVWDLYYKVRAYVRGCGATGYRAAGRSSQSVHR